MKQTAKLPRLPDDLACQVGVILQNQNQSIDSKQMMIFEMYRSGMKLK